MKQKQTKGRVSGSVIGVESVEAEVLLQASKLLELLAAGAVTLGQLQQAVYHAKSDRDVMFTLSDLFARIGCPGINLTRLVGQINGPSPEEEHFLQLLEVWGSGEHKTQQTWSGTKIYGPLIAELQVYLFLTDRSKVTDADSGACKSLLKKIDNNSAMLAEMLEAQHGLPMKKILELTTELRKDYTPFV